MAYKSQKPEQMIRTTDKILSKAVISPALRDAVKELRSALKSKDYEKASELSTVKSFVMGGMHTDRYNHFGEQPEVNRKNLRGADVYQLLDRMNFDISMMVGDMPSGMMEISAEGVRQRVPRRIKSKTLSLIDMERRHIQREAEAERKKLKEVV